MGKAAIDAMNLEDSSSLFKSKKTYKTTDINQMDFGAILWTVIKRYKYGLSVTLNIILFSLLTNIPFIAYDAMFRR